MTIGDRRDWSSTCALPIYTMQYVKSPIVTMCLGQAASMGAVLLTGGEKGKRYALPHSRILIHQPLGGVQGQATDINIQAKEILRMRDEINNIFTKHTDQPLEKISLDTERDFYMNAEQAKEYGIIDEIVEKRK
jgi:ATP-dependent Clp protease, protease subunit